MTPQQRLTLTNTLATLDSFDMLDTLDMFDTENIREGFGARTDWFDPDCYDVPMTSAYALFGI